MNGDYDETASLGPDDEPYEVSSHRLLAQMSDWADQRVAEHEERKRQLDRDREDAYARQQAGFDEMDKIMSGEIPWQDAWDEFERQRNGQ